MYLRTTLRNLAPTFGNVMGAQLLDIYVHSAGRDRDVDGGTVPVAELHGDTVERTP